MGEQPRPAPGTRTRRPAPCPVPLSEACGHDVHRLATGIAEVDRVLGGGLVPGSVVLVAGDPGVGKSTLLLQLVAGIAKAGRRCLYVAGEESVAQVGLRARRIGTAQGAVDVVAETSTDAVTALIESRTPAAVVVDSVQTLTADDVGAAPGSVSQVREATGRLVEVAKRTGVPLFLVGHVTKDGGIAGPRILEHMVDVVVHFEGERTGAFRTLRAIKNRFGSASEFGVFEMRGEGLVEVPDPSKLLLAERPRGAVGSVVAVTADGSRPLLCEVQALVAECTGGPPRRAVTGLDPARVPMLLAVLGRAAGENVLAKDVFVNVAGGLRIEETAADLAVCVAVASSARGRPVPEGVAVFGEVGLSGEVRSVARADLRIAAAIRTGIRTVVVPASTRTQIPGATLRPVRSVTEALGILVRP